METEQNMFAADFGREKLEPGSDPPKGRVQGRLHQRWGSNPEEINPLGLKFKPLSTRPFWLRTAELLRACSKSGIYFGDKEEPPNGFSCKVFSLDVPFPLPNGTVLVRPPLTALFKIEVPFAFFAPPTLLDCVSIVLTIW